MDNKIVVTPRETIPAIHAIEEGGRTHELGELRDLRWNEALRSFLHSAGNLSISWVRLGPGQVLKEHRHPIQSMLVCYAGSGQVRGDLRRPIAAGDIVVIPAGCEHGFVGGPESLFGLSIQFGEGLYTVPERPRVKFSEGLTSLSELLAYNEERLAWFVRLPIFELLVDGTLEDPRKRRAFLDHLQIWVDGNQTLLFSRQASCDDPKYKGVFFQHFKEEIGHDVLHAERAEGRGADQPPARDAVLEAITDWFAYNMFLLDNAEKTAIIHLVIENASAAYHRHAMPVLSRYVSSHYFEVHVEADAGHAALGEALLRDVTPAAADRLRKLIGEAWDMIGAMTDRVVELTRAA